MTGGVDGRSARRTANRDRVVDAMLALLDEGHLEPRIEAIVERSGVSQRSVFRYFEGLDDLRRAVMRRNFERVAPLMVIDRIGEGPLDERIDRFVAVRLDVCEAVAGPARVALHNAPFQPVLAKEVGRFRALLEEQVRAHFAPELRALDAAEADEVALAIDVLVSFDAWNLLTTAHRRTRPQISRTWTGALGRLLSARAG